MRPLSLFDRFVLTVFHAAITLAMLVWLLGLFIAPLRMHLERTSLWSPALAVPVAVFAAAASLRFIYLATVGRRGRRAVVHDLPLGRVRISVHAIEALVQRLTRAVRGIKEARAIVTIGDNGLMIRIKATVGPEVAIPETSNEIQQLVKHQVRQVAGVVVHEVEIDVRHITPEPKRGRVE